MGVFTSDASFVSSDDWVCFLSFDGRVVHGLFLCCFVAALHTRHYGTCDFCWFLTSGDVFFVLVRAVRCRFANVVAKTGVLMARGPS